MRLGPGPIRVRIEAEGEEAAELLARAAEDGLVLAGPGEEIELVARPPAARLEPRLEPGLAGRREPKSAASLSPRELEILDYLADGWSNAEIASVLRIGVRTVRFHLEGIYGKLGVSRRGEAVREAFRLGLIRFEA